MTESVTVQQILQRYLVTPPSHPRQRQVSQHMMRCRTEAMGGRVMHCGHCGEEQTWYYSCRDRHCPQCQGQASRRWAERQQADILPVQYFHLVFTLPHVLNGWVQVHPEVIYRRLFQAAWQTLQAFGRDPKRLNGELGMTAVLHTWGQNLSQHVHLHCLVPGGALDEAGHWHACKSNYLFPVRALSRHYRGRMVTLLREAAQAGELDRLRPDEVENVLNGLFQSEWVIYTKHCLQHTDTVVRYLSRYTHRSAIHNSRLLGMDDEGVTFRYKDYRADGKSRTMTLSGAEFVRRLLLHVLPKGLMRIRHFGLLANRHRQTRLAQVREALLVFDAGSEETSAPQAVQPTLGYPCPTCKQGRLLVIAELLPCRPNESWGVRRR